MAVSLIGVVIFMGSVDFTDNLNLGRPRCQKVSNKKHSSSGNAGVPSIALATEGVSPACCLATDGSTRRRDASAPRRWKNGGGRNGFEFLNQVGMARCAVRAAVRGAIQKIRNSKGGFFSSATARA